MNNKIDLRTDKGEYCVESDIHGAVYLNICQPTEATGIKISFKGVEKCFYEYSLEGKKESKTTEFIPIDISDVPLYSHKDKYFEFGKYVFPFKFSLPGDIPGSFSHAKKTEKDNLTASVRYFIKAVVIGAENIQIEHPIVVYQVREQEINHRLFVEAVNRTVDVPGLFMFKRKQIHITAKLLDNFVESGSKVQLKVIVTNESSLKLTSFSIKLIRDLKLYFQSPSDDSHQTVCPEGGQLVLRSAYGNSDSILISGGLDKLQLPLFENLPEGIVDVPPSVSGKIFKNQYGVEVSVSFNNKCVETFIINIPGVLPRKNHHWCTWHPPDWLFDCSVKLSSCQFSVTESVLHTEAFSNLPMFQVL